MIRWEPGTVFKLPSFRLNPFTSGDATRGGSGGQGEEGDEEKNTEGNTEEETRKKKRANNCEQDQARMSRRSTMHRRWSRRSTS